MRKALSLTLLVVGVASASAQVAAPVPAIKAAGAVGADAAYDYNASVTLSREDIAGDRFAQTSRQLFEAYLSHEGIRGLAASVARGRFEAVLGNNAEFAREHADSLTLSFATVNAGGEERFAQRTRFKYNGRDVTVYRYRQGMGSASSVFIDGQEAKGPDGRPLQFFTKDRETYLKFKAWFEGTLGRPEARP